MSGIYGFSLLNPTKEELETTLGGLEYWNRIYGRAAHGSKLSGNFALGCHLERLSERFPIPQPVLELHGRDCVVDALIYNRDELLDGLGMDADTRIPDEELLLRWIEARGFHALAQVNGDFAGAILDPETGEWTIFRDHVGVRPLYLYCNGRCFAFSTDIRGILSLQQADASPNELRLFRSLIGQNYLALRETDYLHIHAVRPAAITRIRMHGTGFSLKEKPYWKLRSKRIRLASDEAYQRELRRLVTDSVSRRLDAFPGLIGGELSGGLDSGVIDILINRLGREGRYVSWSPSPDCRPLRDGEDERHIVNDICRQESIECSYLDPNDMIDLGDCMDRAVPPFFDTPMLGYGSALLRRAGARVVFTGHGGDEGVSHRCNRLEPLTYGEYFSFFRLYWEDLKGTRFRLLKTFKSSFQDLHRLYKKVYTPADEQDMNDPLFTEKFRSRMKSRYRHNQLTFAYDPVRYVMHGGTQFRLNNAAYQGAFHDVRYVYPYLDYRVLDFALSIPRVQYLGKMNRRIFREAFRDIIPDSLYRLGYKDFASKRNTPRRENFRQQFQYELDWIRKTLNPDVWGEILDLDYIPSIQPSDDPRSFEHFVVKHKIHQLERLILIQNAREKALKWREFDEQNILL